MMISGRRRDKLASGPAARPVQVVCWRSNCFTDLHRRTLPYRWKWIMRVKSWGKMGEASSVFVTHGCDKRWAFSQDCLCWAKRRCTVPFCLLDYIFFLASRLITNHTKAVLFKWFITEGLAALYIVVSVSSSGILTGGVGRGTCSP